MKFFTMLAAVLMIMFPAAPEADARVIHVLVALCDNEHQGIVPVSADLGNKPAINLYWGAMFGVSTHLKKHPDWSLEFKQTTGLPEEILERLVFRSKKDPEVWLAADAYAGRHIQKCTEDFFSFAAGQSFLPVVWEGGALVAGGGADLLVYMGHNGLMDFNLDNYPSGSFDELKRETAVFSCVSEAYFKNRLIRAGSWPIMTTRQLMAPEAYILAALAEGWIKGEEPAALHERVAQAYNRYQKCGIKAARNTFAVPGGD